MANTLHRSQIGLDGKHLPSQKWECALRQQLSVSRDNFLTHFNISKSVKLHYRKIYPAELVVYCPALKPVFVLEKVRKIFAGTLPEISLFWMKRWTHVGTCVNRYKAKVLSPAVVTDVCWHRREVRGGNTGRQQPSPAWCGMAAAATAAAEAQGCSVRPRCLEGAGPSSSTGKGRKRLIFRGADSPPSESTSFSADCGEGGRWQGTTGLLLPPRPGV